MKTLPPEIQSLSRRDLLIKTGKLSVAGMAMLVGMNAKAFATDNAVAGGQYSDASQDIDVLNEILGTEYEGISTYQIFAEAGLFQGDLLKTTLLFQDHHKEHSEILMSAIKKLGGVPMVGKNKTQYGDDLNTSSIKTEEEALKLMSMLERGAANAYINMLPFTHDRELAKIAGRIAADEVMHWTTISALLKEALPANALSFGA